MSNLTIEKIKRDIIATVLQAVQPKTSPYDTDAEVTRVEGDTAYVHIASGVSETPVDKIIDAKKGDKVKVRLSGGNAWITGNATAPPTDDTKAEEAKQEIAKTNIIVKAVKNIAEQAQKIAGNTNQYFWHTQEGTDTGAHITEIPQEDFIADPANGGGNLLARSNGIAVRDGLAELATFAAKGMALRDSSEDLLFKAANNGDYFVNVVDYPVESDGITPVYNWEPNETTTKTATITVEADMPYINCIKEIRIVFANPVAEGGIDTIVTATFTPSQQTYTGGGYTISYSHPSALTNREFSLTIKKNNAEDKYISVYDIKVTYDLGYSTSTTVCGVHSATEDIDVETTEKAFVVGAGTPEYGKDAFSVGYSGDAYFSDSVNVGNELIAWQVRVGGNVEPIGSYHAKNATTAALTANIDSYKAGASLTLDAGVYVIYCYGSMGTNSSAAQQRAIRLYRVSPNAAGLWSWRNVYPNGNWATISATLPIKLEETTTLRVDASASVAGNGASTWIIAVRIA